MSESNFRVLTEREWLLIGPLEDELGVDTLKDLHAAVWRAPPDREVRLRMSSTGGQVVETLAAARLIQRKLKAFEITIIGEACSAAVDFLVLAGTQRVAVPTAWFMVHPAAYADSFNPGQWQSYVDKLEADHAWLCREYARKLGRTVRFWRSFFSQKRFFGPEEAKELKIIQEVL